MSNEKIEYANKNRSIEYKTLLTEVQALFVKDNWELLKGIVTEEEKREKSMAFFLKQIQDRNIHYDGYTSAELALRLHKDIREFSILTDYLNDENVEGINVNAWNNIRVKYHNGKQIKAEHFLDANHAITITKRLLEQSNTIIDEAVPIAEGSIGSNIRITAVISPIVDEDVGVAMYIRKLRSKVFTTDEYAEKNFATPQILKAIQIASKRGVSTLFLGKVNTGKTTLATHALYCLPDETQIITIESGAREIDLIKKDDNGNPINNVVHLKTRHSVIEEQNITQEKLVVIALRLNPDELSVAEMRDVEAHSAIEASNSGHTVASTAHAGSVKYGHKRIANLARKKYPTDFHTALIDAVEAFPLGVFIHTTEDGIRRIMNVSEAYVDGNDEIHYNTLWQYKVEKNIKHTDGSTEVIGHYQKLNSPSDNLIEIMRLYGITNEELNVFNDGGEE